MKKRPCSILQGWQFHAQNAVMKEIGLGRGNIALIGWLAENEAKRKSGKYVAILSHRDLTAKTSLGYTTVSSVIPLLIKEGFMKKEDKEYILC